MIIDTSDEAFWDYANDLRPEHREKLLNLANSIAREFPQLERVMAWEIPYFRAGTQFIIGLEVVYDEILLRLWQIPGLDDFTNRLANYGTDRNAVILDVWEDLNEPLVHDLVTECLKHTFT